MIEEFAGADVWYIFVVALHFIQALLIGFETHSGIVPLQLLSMLESFDVLMIIIQILNLIVVMTFFSTAEYFIELTPDI